MKRFTTRLLAACCLMILASAALVPYVANAQCPIIVVECSGGKTYGCSGTPQGDKCSYDRDCLNKGRCGGGEELLIE